MSDEELTVLAGVLAEPALRAGLRVVTAESCTGGWIAKALTDVAGSSGWFECGWVTYSNAAKIRDLGVSQATLEEHGAVSEATVREMAVGALRASTAQISVAVSGVAGPDGGTAAKPVGTVWFGFGRRSSAGLKVSTEHRRFGGDREAVRQAAVAHALRALRQLLEGGVSTVGS